MTLLETTKETHTKAVRTTRTHTDTLSGRSGGAEGVREANEPPITTTYISWYKHSCFWKRFSWQSGKFWWCKRSGNLVQDIEGLLKLSRVTARVDHRRVHAHVRLHPRHLHPLQHVERLPKVAPRQKLRHAKKVSVLLRTWYGDPGVWDRGGRWAGLAGALSRGVNRLPETPGTHVWSSPTDQDSASNGRTQRSPKIIPQHALQGGLRRDLLPLGGALADGDERGEDHRVRGQAALRQLQE